jgi:hypothetical protein
VGRANVPLVQRVGTDTEDPNVGNNTAMPLTNLSKSHAIESWLIRAIDKNPNRQS